MIRAIGVFNTSQFRRAIGDEVFRPAVLPTLHSNLVIISSSKIGVAGIPVMTSKVIVFPFWWTGRLGPWLVPASAFPLPDVGGITTRALNPITAYPYHCQYPQ